MQAVARARYLKGSALKMRQVLDNVRGKKVEEALNLLRLHIRKALYILKKYLEAQSLTL